MAFEDLSLIGRLWRNHGLLNVLLPYDAPRTSPVSPKHAASSRPKTSAPAAENSRSFTVATKNSPQVAKEKPQPQLQILPTEAWPEVWRTMLSATKKGLFAWTYLGLGQDLHDAKKPGGDAAREKQRLARGNFLRRLLADLGHPAGTHTFWPLDMPVDKGNMPRGDIFWSALQLLGCRGVVVMGSAAAKIIVPDEKLKPLMQLRKHGMFIWILRDIDDLTNAPEKYAPVPAFLRKAFTPFVHI